MILPPSDGFHIFNFLSLVAPKHGIIGYGISKSRGAQVNKNGLKLAQDVWDVQHKDFLPIKRNVWRFRIDARENGGSRHHG